MRVLVVDTVHHPRDARISERQISALLAAGHEVTQAMPFTAFGATPLPGVAPIDLPSARGRHRLRAVRAARKVLLRESPEHDVVILHSPELLLAARGIQHPAMVWDVHEDTAAAVTMRTWVPGPLKPVARRGVAWAEARAENRRRLLLAEDAYAERFSSTHPVVPNTPRVPAEVRPSGRGRVVYVGSVTRARGGDELIELGRRLAPDIVVEVMGEAHGDMASRLSLAEQLGYVRWYGFVANDEALQRLEGATAGLSLLHDEENYRHSMPTKILEYLSRGVPAVVTPLPLARDVIKNSGGGIVVGFGDVASIEAAVRHLNADDSARQAMADSGRSWIRAHADWNIDGPAFVAILESWASGDGNA